MSSAAGSQALAAPDNDDAILSIVPLAVTLSPSDPDRESDVSVKKRKRVRTGCFTCRDRHLKCDAAHGQCQNCLKSGRLCRRGVRLNFVDTQVSAPPTYIQPPAANGVTFRDDSRVIASEYVGGDEVYPPLDKVPPLVAVRETSTPVQSASDLLSKQYPLDRQSSINDPIELSFMQAFINRIGPWLDALDEQKHLTRVLPLYAFQVPLLRAVIAACSGRYVSLQLSLESSESLSYYITAAQMLSNSLATQQGDSSLCAAASLILEIAEKLILGPISSELRICSRYSARSLIRECQWNTQTQGLGGACSWISIFMELLDCIAFQQPLVWDPGSWGVDMGFSVEPPLTGNEHLWIQRIIFICAKVSDFRSSKAHGTGKSTRNAEAQRLQEWGLYSDWCDKWFASIPRSMLPLGQIQPWQRHPQSAFPEIWLLDRPAVVAQIFYHVTRIMLVETDPSRKDDLHEMQEELQRHTHNVCGIVTNDKDIGVPIFPIPLFAFAAGYLIDRHAQEEAIAFLDQLKRTTGMNTEHHQSKLREAWGWHSNGHEPLPHCIDTGTLSLDFHTHDPSNDYHHSPLTDPFPHSLIEPHGYLDHHITFEHP
ncbi:hypothetical protein BDV06DRAFT_57099 [Aspergillus oleicola]